MTEWTFWLIVLHALAISDIVAILVQINLLDSPRNWLKANYPRSLGKLSECQFCQSFWLAGLDVFFGCPTWIVVWFALHRVILLTNEFCDRYLNRAPLTIFNLSQPSPEQPKVEKEAGS